MQLKKKREKPHILGFTWQQLNSSHAGMMLWYNSVSALHFLLLLLLFLSPLLLLFLCAGLHCVTASDGTPLPPTTFHNHPGARRPSVSKVRDGERPSPRRPLIAFSFVARRWKRSGVSLGVAASACSERRFHCGRGRAGRLVRVHGALQQPDPCPIRLFIIEKRGKAFIIDCIEEEILADADACEAFSSSEGNERRRSSWVRSTASDSESIWLNLTTHQGSEPDFH